MKILVIDGCHRKGNTWKITQKAMEEIKEFFPDVTYEEIVLIKENLPFAKDAVVALELAMISAHMVRLCVEY